MDRRRSLLAAVAVGGALVLGACTSQPSAKAVAKDVVESLPDLTATQRDCMIEVIDGYSTDELDAIGEANVDEVINGTQHGTPQMQTFIDKLSDCREPG